MISQVGQPPRLSQSEWPCNRVWCKVLISKAEVLRPSLLLLWPSLPTLDSGNDSTAVQDQLGNVQQVHATRCFCSLGWWNPRQMGQPGLGQWQHRAPLSRISWGMFNKFMLPFLFLLLSWMEPSSHSGLWGWQDCCPESAEERSASSSHTLLLLEPSLHGAIGTLAVTAQLSRISWGMFIKFSLGWWNCRHMGQFELWRWQYSCAGSAEACSTSSCNTLRFCCYFGWWNRGHIGEIQKLVVTAQLSRKISPAATGSMHCSIFCSANWIGAGQQVLWLSIIELPWSQQSKPSFLSHDDLMGHEWDYHGLSGDISINIYIYII